MYEKFKKIVAPENIKIDEPMKKHTSFKVGGNAGIMVFPDDELQIKQIIDVCKKNNVKYFIMGNGSNLIVSDKGINAVVIKLFDNFSGIFVKENILEVKAGTLLSKISSEALNHSLSGLEFASGIPGTLGGAIIMNAGAYGSEMKDIVYKTFFIDKAGNFSSVEGKEHDFGYRTSIFQKNEGIVLKSELKLVQGNPKQIKCKMNELNTKRREKQPLDMPSAGSIFKRPPGYFAGKLIEDCGLKGFRIGGAEVSTKHSGFIVNRGNATSDDIINVIEYVKEEVKKKFGVMLETEVKIWKD